MLVAKLKRWEVKLEMCMEYEDFVGNFQDIYKVTNITKYCSFQYRLLMRGLVTNVQLNKWKLVETDKCSLCNQATETYVHLFVWC